MTVTVPVSVATFPIGSSAVVGAGEAAAGSAACASLVRSVPTSFLTLLLASFAAAAPRDGIATRLCALPSTSQPRSASASESRYVTLRPNPGRSNEYGSFGGLRKPAAERRVNIATEFEITKNPAGSSAGAGRMRERAGRLADPFPGLAAAEQAAEGAALDLQQVRSLHCDGGVVVAAALRIMDPAGPFVVRRLHVDQDRLAGLLGITAQIL